jgi:hypothetical protein
MTDASACPSEFGLERLRLAELEDPEAGIMTSHVQACSECSRRLVALSATPAPLDLDRVWRAAHLESAAVRTRPSWGRRLAARWVLAFTATAAAATAVVMVTVRPGTTTDVLKGGGDPWTFTVVVKRRGQQKVQRPASGVRLSVGDQLRFEVTARSGSGYAAVVGSDSRGVVTPLAPPAGDTVLVRGGPVVLEGAVELDDAPGAERLDWFGCSRAIAVAELVRAVRDGVAPGCYRQTFWIEKVKP